jgi:hypothetical protein
LFVSELQAALGQHLRHVTHIGLMNGSHTTQLALVLGGLLGQNVTLEGMAALDGTTWTNAKALFSAALGLHFGHVNAPLIVLVRRLQTFANLLAPRHF